MASERTKYRLAMAWRLGLIVVVVYLGDDLGQTALDLWHGMARQF